MTYLKMKLALHSLRIFTLSLVISRSPGRTEVITDDPYAVTPYFPGLKNLYSQLRSPTPDPKAKSRLSTGMKWRICKKIFNRRPPEFKSADDWHEILLDPKVLESLLKYDFRYQSIFYDIFEKYRRRVLRIPIPGSRVYRYVNRSKLRPIYVNGNLVQENTFLCLVGGFRFDAENKAIPSTRIIRQYYVSDNDYNMNEAPDRDPTVGRFIFFYDQELQYLGVFALAEESPPIIQDDSNGAIRYLERRRSTKPTSKMMDDPLCKLDESRKLRICHSVLMEMQKKMVGEVMADPGCVRRPFRFAGESDEFFDEWTMKCSIVPRPKLLVSSPMNTPPPGSPGSFHNILLAGYMLSPTPSYLASPLRSHMTSPHHGSPSPGSPSPGSTTPNHLFSLPSSDGSPTPNYQLGSSSPGLSTPNYQLASPTNSPFYYHSSSSSPSHSGLSSAAGSFGRPSWSQNSNLSINDNASSSTASPSFVFYVSRAYIDNEVFLFMPDANLLDVVWLHGYKTKIAVVRDSGESSTTPLVRSEGMLEEITEKTDELAISLNET